MFKFTDELCTFSNDEFENRLNNIYPDKLQKWNSENPFRFNNDPFDKALLSIKVQSNIKVIDSAHNWNILLIKEALLNNQKMPKLNNGLKTFKDLRFLN